MYLKYLLIIMFPILYRRCITTCISSEIITKDSFSSVCTSVLLFLFSLKKKMLNTRLNVLYESPVCTRIFRACEEATRKTEEENYV